MRTHLFAIVFLRLALFWISCQTGLAASSPYPDLAHRRASVMEQMHGNGIFILLSAEPRVHSRDTTYDFRQDSDLYYLTGTAQSGTSLVLMPGNLTFREILFLRKPNPTDELWTGRMLTQEEATHLSGIRNVWPANELEPFLDAVLSGSPYRQAKYRNSLEYEAFFRELRDARANVFLMLDRAPGLNGELDREHTLANRLRERFPGLSVRDGSRLVHQLRLVKSDHEISLLERAIATTMAAFEAALKVIRPGAWEYEVKAAVDGAFGRRNSVWGFPSIIASGENATVLHCTSNQRQMQARDVILMDIGAAVDYYSADLTRTVPVSGRFTPEQAELYRLVLRAWKAAVRAVKPGACLEKVHEAAVQELKNGLLQLGLITDAASEQYRAFCPHGTCHWLGLDVHDVGDYSTPFREGMVLTVEPGIYVRDDAVARLEEHGANTEALEVIRPALQRYRSLGIRIEDDVLVTGQGCRVLSADLPRELDAVEALLSASPNP